MKKLALIFLVLGACHEKQELTPPPAPLRPEAEPKQEVQVAKDCDPTDPASELKAISFDQRSIPEGMRLADQAYAKLNSANSAEVDRLTREQYQSDAVNDFLTALAADPYNVKATYGLAAAYAKIGRKQCSINLLTRILQMRTHASKKDDVEKAIDKLLGRKQALDPDFADMRRDSRFRELIAKMCDGTNDPNCVYGGEK
jgi:lipopolysaccharide biosynthesis regulator YciM